MNIIMQINGGLGKHLQATSMVKWAAEKYPEQKIVVVSGYPEIFEYNPRIHRNLGLTQSYLFEDYVKGHDFRTGDPYTLPGYYNERRHIMNLFPLAYGFGEENQSPEMEAFFTAGELEEAVAFSQGPPIVTLQNMGGTLPGSPVNARKSDDLRTMPRWIAEQLVSGLSARGFRVLQIRQATEPQLPGTVQFTGKFRQLMALASQIKGHVGIDSSMMHCAALHAKPMMIFWASTVPSNLGYDYGVVSNKYKYITGRPVFGIPDNAGVMAYRDPREKECWDYTKGDISACMEEFAESLKKEQPVPAAVLVPACQGDCCGKENATSRNCHW